MAAERPADPFVGTGGGTGELNSEENLLPPGWEVRTMEDGRIYYAK